MSRAWVAAFQGGARQSSTDLRLGTSMIYMRGAMLTGKGVNWRITSLTGFEE
jgi:hypothetical protein